MRLFLLDNIPFVILYCFNQFILFGVYYWAGGFGKIGNILYFIFLSTFLLLLFLIYRYLTNRRLYKILGKKPSDLEDTLITLGSTHIAEGVQILLKEQYCLYQERIQKYIKTQNEHLTFINQWVHQMKTPLSVIQLIVQENEDELYMNNIKEEVERLNKGLNMALYTARLDTFQQDFKVETINLNKLVLEVVNEHKILFIRKQVYPEVKMDPITTIQSDAKWLRFILEQLLINAIKYSYEKNKKVYILEYSKETDIVLEIKDQGIGIPKNDIRRVFEAFYTGENGRRFGESTGMGLYIVREVCKQLEHRIEIESEVGKGTIVRMIFQNAHRNIT